jgi:tetratricopeptide (TPR) repeat protein
MKIYILFFILLSTPFFAQKDGYWDKERNTNKQIVVKAGERIIIKSEDFPRGTTEFVYRITLLDDNQQLSSSLVSLLKSIPDPTGYSQGAAGGIFILSKVSGDDTCKYALFSDSKLAENYKETGKPVKAILFQNEPVDKDSKLIKLNATKELFESKNVWFGFESQNWVMHEKIVLEIVPWVNNELHRGWNTASRMELLKDCKSSEISKKMINSESFCVGISNLIQKKYTIDEYQKLLDIEKNKLLNEISFQCLSDKSTNNSILVSARLDANEYFRQGKYAEAINLLNSVVFDFGNTKITDYCSLGKYYLFSKQYDKALKILKEGEKTDASELLIQLNLAHLYVLIDDFRMAKELHKKYKNQNVTATESWKNKTKSDFEEFQKTGTVNKDFERIIKILEN